MEKQNLTVRKLPDPPEAPEEPDMNAVYIKAYEGKVDDLIKLLAKAAGSKDGAKIIKRLPGFDGKNDIKELQKNPEAFIKSFLKNEEDLEELLETIQDSKLGDKLMTLLEKTPAGQGLLKDISENFFVVHLHPNNFEPWSVLNGFALPSVLEVTYLNKKYATLIEDKVKVFPTKLDFPNDASREMFLGSFIY